MLPSDEEVRVDPEDYQVPAITKEGTVTAPDSRAQVSI